MRNFRMLSFYVGRALLSENISKIQYLSVVDKIYKVKNIDFHNLTIEATKTDLSIADVPKNEIFPLEDFREFRIRLCNVMD